MKKKAHQSNKHKKQEIAYINTKHKIKQITSQTAKLQLLWMTSVMTDETHRSSDDPVFSCHKLRGSDREVTYFKRLDKSLGGINIIVRLCFTALWLSWTVIQNQHIHACMIIHVFFCGVV